MSIFVQNSNFTITSLPTTHAIQSRLSDALKLCGLGNCDIPKRLGPKHRNPNSRTKSEALTAAVTTEHAAARQDPLFRRHALGLRPRAGGKPSMFTFSFGHLRPKQRTQPTKHMGVRRASEDGEGLDRGIEREPDLFRRVAMELVHQADIKPSTRCLVDLWSAAVRPFV